MDKLRNLSIRKAIIVYIFISLLVSFLLWAVAVDMASRAQTRLVWKYTDEEMNYDPMHPNEYPPERPNVYLMTDGDRLLMELCDFVLTYGFLVLSVPGVVIAVALFYQNKISKPLGELGTATQRIAENDLDFHIAYQNRDELGRLCAEFERMRAELEANERKMWRMVEAEKTLRAAIAHDIRTPLATLRGYQEMLLEFLPQGTLSREKTEEMLQEGMEQIDRLSRFVETMRRLSGLDERKAVREQTVLVRLEERLERSAQTLAGEYGRRISVSMEHSVKVFQADEELVLEVAENLMANALRFAKEQVEVRISLEGDMLVLEVLDDGMGYPEGFVLPEAPYRQGSTGQDQRHHLGLGLYISRICCEKHGGSLTTENQDSGGAAARAVFWIG